MHGSKSDSSCSAKPYTTNIVRAGNLSVYVLRFGSNRMIIQGAILGFI